jgi:hypothetical protein
MSAMKKSPIAIISNLTVALLLASLVAQLVGVWYVFDARGTIDDFHAGAAGLDEVEAQFARLDQLGELLFAIGVLACLALAVWFTRALRTARARGAEGMRYRHGWPWFFVPVLNLYRPYEAMTELWQASHGAPAAEHTWRRRPVSVVVQIWWGVFILNGILGMMFIGEIGQLPDDRTVLLGGYALASTFVSVLCVILEIGIVRRVAEALVLREPDDEMPAARVVS